MVPVDQRETTGCGDCVRACVASILEVPLENVPHFLRESGANWLLHLERWLEEKHRLGALLVRRTDPPCCTMPRGFVIASGPSSVGSKHSIVWHEGIVAHDPHPQRPGLDRIDDFLVFTHLGGGG